MKAQQRSGAGEPAEARFGGWIMTRSREATELVARAGFDFVVLPMMDVATSLYFRRTKPNPARQAAYKRF